MPRVHFVKKARKDNPVCKAGESYYWWKNRFGPKRYSKNPPRQSQLVTSDKLSRLYEAQEMVEDAPQPHSEMSADELDDLITALNDAEEQVREVGEEYEESHQNMEEHFPSGSPNMELCEEMRDKCENTTESLSDARSEVEDAQRELAEVENQLEELEEELDKAEGDEQPEGDKGIEYVQGKIDELHDKRETLMDAVQSAVDGIDWDI